MSAARGRARLAVLAAVGACIGVGAASAAGLATRGDKPTLSIATNPSANAPALSGLDIALAAGARGSFIAFPWSELEPSPGRYNVGHFRALTYLGRTRGLKLLLGVAVVNTVARETPRDLMGVPFDSPRMKQRFHRLIDALRPYLAHNVAFVSLGNEVDVYLARHPAEWASYREFYEDAVSYVHRAAPSVQVGVTTTFSGAVRKHVRKVA